MSDFKLKLYHFEKEGKGVEPGEKKIASLQLFVLYFRNFWKLTLYNLSLFASLLPSVCVLCALFIILLGEDGINNLLNSDSFQSLNQSFPWIMIFTNIYYFFIQSNLTMSLGLLLLLASLLSFGPLSAGFFYAVRNISREEHVFTSDLYSQAWSNKKQSVPIGILDFILTTAILLYFMNDYSMLNEGNYRIIGVAKYIALIVYAFYLVARVYIYTILVTFDMPLSQCIKNGLTMAYAHLGRFFLSLLILAAVVALNLWLPLPSLLLLPLFDISFACFSAGFIAYPPIDRYMIQPALSKERSDNSDD